MMDLTTEHLLQTRLKKMYVKPNDIIVFYAPPDWDREFLNSVALQLRSCFNRIGYIKNEIVIVPTDTRLLAEPADDWKGILGNID